MASLNALSARLAAEADPDPPFTPKGATLTIGMVHGGTAHNIIARECEFVFDLRTAGGRSPEEIIAPFLAECAEMDRALKARAPEAGVAVDMRTSVPPFVPEADGAAEAFARRMAGDNGPPRVVAFAAEAGQFQRAGFSTVICGPGSIEQAHQPDEFVEIAQMQRGAHFMRRRSSGRRRGRGPAKQTCHPGFGRRPKTGTYWTLSGSTRTAPTPRSNSQRGAQWVPVFAGGETGMTSFCWFSAPRPAGPESPAACR
jgi:hypothetical protein